LILFLGKIVLFQARFSLLRFIKSEKKMGISRSKGFEARFIFLRLIKYRRKYFDIQNEVLPLALI
jgi:hypothetical protein